MGLSMICLLPLLLHAKEAKTSSTKTNTSSSKSSPSKNNQNGLDKNLAQNLYQEGDFEQLVKLLENIRRERQMRNRDDSVFIYKYLGVIYGADEVTKKKAESFLYQMLKISPEENLSRLGVGDSIEAIFRRVRSRFEEQEGVKTNHSNPAFDSAIALQKRNEAKKVPGTSTSLTNQNNSSKMWMWIAGGTAAAATITGIVLYSTGGTETKTQVHTINGELK